MPSVYSSAALLAASASLALAAPTTFKKGFSVPRVRTGHINKPAAAVWQAYAKYNVPVPANVKAAADGGTGSVSANPQPYDSEYLSPVTVGNNQLNLDFDTGSSDLWVFSTITPSDQSSGHNLYDTSTGREQDGETWQIRYGDGSSASGTVYTDAVNVGGASVTGQFVEAATDVAQQFQQGAGDGLLGLGYESGNTCQPNQCQTFFGNLQSSVPSPLFTADLQTDGGSYDFGYIDDSKHSGDITYVNVLQQNPSYWDFTAGALSVNGQSSDIGYAIMDTGTSLWYLPEDATSTYYGQVDGAENDSSQGGYVFSCDAQLPDASVDIGGTTFTVPGSALSFQPLNDGSGNCFGGIQPSGDGLPAAIFGDVFMKNFFVVFNLGENTLGVAAQ